MRNEATILKEGMEALKSRLDPVEFEKFLMIIRRDVFDYTEWQRNLWSDKTVSEIFKIGREKENHS